MLPQPVKYVLERLGGAGFAAYAVGGCVRDTLLGRTPCDWDVTTAARTRCSSHSGWRTTCAAGT